MRVEADDVEIGLHLENRPVIPGVRFRRSRRPEDHPGMLRVFSAAHAADGLEDVERSRTSTGTMRPSSTATRSATSDR